MRKIKKFRIPIYTYDILRKAKKRKVDLFALGLADQDSAKEYIASIAAALEPSTIFDRLDPAEELAGRAGLGKGAAGTLGVVTLGAAFAAKLESIKEPGLFTLAETAARVFADTGLKVVSELIDQEISSEGLALGDLARLYSFASATDEEEGEGAPAAASPSDIGLAAACLERLTADRIGVSSDGAAVSPRHTVVFSIPWLAAKKKKAASGPSSR